MFELPGGVSVATIEAGLVLLDGDRGRYWQLNRTGAAMVSLLLEGRTPEQVAAALAEQTAAAAEQILPDVQALISQLCQARLMRSVP